MEEDGDGGGGYELGGFVGEGDLAGEDGGYSLQEEQH